jgi:hypothetical protein
MENTFENDCVVVGKVYKLFCKDETIKDCYIGSSVNIQSRLHKHKSNTQNENSPKHHLRVYQKIRECGGWDNWKCEILDELENPSRSQLIELERMYYEENIENATLNTTYCGRTKKETNKAWWAKNPNYMIDYREKYPEKVKTYNNNYYAKNHERIKEYYKQKVVCSCGCQLNKGSLLKHLKTKKHLNGASNNITT